IVAVPSWAARAVQSRHEHITFRAERAANIDDRVHPAHGRRRQLGVVNANPQLSQIKPPSPRQRCAGEPGVTRQANQLARALALIWSNSAWVIAPLSSRPLACTI